MNGRRHSNPVWGLVGNLMASVTALAVVLTPSATLANPPRGADAQDAHDVEAEPAAPEKVPVAERPGKKGVKATGGDAKQHASKKAKKGRRHQKDATNAPAPKTKKTKKTAARGAAGSKKRGGKKAPPEAKAPPPCLGPAVALDRGGEEAESLVLVDCHGAPRKEASARLSILARPWGAARPSGLEQAEGGRAKKDGKKGMAAGDELAPGVRRLDPGLLTRIDAIARKFPGKTISLVSGYRPQSRGSLHQSGRAVDLRIADVDNRQVVEACRTLRDTGCGYYPNSSFVHVDVRSPGTGVVYWIDASGPGEPPRYVSQWPPPPGEAAQENVPPPTKDADDASRADPPAPEIPSVDLDPYDAAADEASSAPAPRPSR